MSRLDWASLAAALDGEVALPGSATYESSPRPFNARFDAVRPTAVASCATTSDVAETIRFARRHHVPLATRNGGHGFADHTATTGVLIDVRPMREVSVAGEVATVGAGALLGEVYDRLQEHGVTIAGGTCPAVGVTGLTLGGGLGLLGRSYGVTSDRLVSAEIVLADGRVVGCDEQHDEDLFWALRGAGAGNFGVVTSLVFRTIPAEAATNVRVTWPFHRAADVVDAWQRRAPTGPDGLAASLKVTAPADVDAPAAVDLFAAFFGSDGDAVEAIDDVIRRAGSEPSSTSVARLSAAQTRRFWAELGRAEEAPAETARSALWAKSEFFDRPLTTDAVAALMQNLQADRRAGQPRELDFMPWGGAYNRVPPRATAFVHRDALFQIKHAVTVAPAAAQHEHDAAHRWVRRSWALVHPMATGRVFQNFVDPELEDWATAYYGENLERLLRVKGRYDPLALFRFHQSLPVA